MYIAWKHCWRGHLFSQTCRDIESAKEDTVLESRYSLLDMLLNSFMTCLALDQVPTEEKARPLFLFDHSFCIFRILLLLRQVNDGNIGSFSSHQNGHWSTNSWAKRYQRLHGIRHSSVKTYSPPVIKTFLSFNLPEPTYSIVSPLDSNLVDSLGGSMRLSSLTSDTV